LGDKSLWLDEVYSIAFARDWSLMWEKTMQDGGNMWFYYLLLHWWIKIGDTEFVVRSLSAIFAVSTVPIVYQLGARLFDARVGLIAALLLSINPFFIEYAQEARGYSLLVLLAAASSNFFAGAMERPSLANSLGYILSSVMTIWVHYFGLLVLIAQAVSLLFYRSSKAPWKWFSASAAIIIALSLLPILVALVLFPSETINAVTWIPRPGLKDIYRLFLLFFSGGSPTLLILYSGLFIVAIAAGVAAFRKSGLRLDAWRYAFLALWLWVPIAASYLFSIFVQPVFWPRYLIICLPALFLLVGTGLTKVRHRWLLATTLIVLIVASGHSLLPWYTETEKENWRAATAFFASEAESGGQLHRPTFQLLFTEKRRFAGPF